MRKAKSVMPKWEELLLREESVRVIAMSRCNAGNDMTTTNQCSKGRTSCRASDLGGENDKGDRNRYAA